MKLRTNPLNLFVLAVRRYGHRFSLHRRVIQYLVIKQPERPTGT